MKSKIALALGVAVAALSTTKLPAETVWLDTLNLSVATQGWGEPHKNQSVDGHTLTIGGKTFERGFGTHAESSLRLKLDGGAQRFFARVGVDDELNNNPAASAEFFVVGDGKELWKSGVMRAGDVAKKCIVDVAGVKSLLLKVGDAGDGIQFDHANWADAKLETVSATTFATSGGLKVTLVAPYILTPPAPATPRINGASVFGVRPGSPFLFTIAATGSRPMTFTAERLPSGLKLDELTGQITGMLKTRGEFFVTLGAKNALGKTEKKFRIVCGDQIALTPPMGWNSWNCFAGEVSAEWVKSAADAMVKSGLINHGWTYINVDDFWQNHRDSKDPTLQGKCRDDKGFVVPNARFPDMKGLADYIHSLGLKAGLYSSPGPWTCGGCVGSWQHEQQDAEVYARWGFDYLKYDWCSYGDIVSRENPAPKDARWDKGAKDSASAIYPYDVMGKFLREQPRDIVFSLCQYGNADVWKWGGAVNGNCWRTTGDIVDLWGKTDQNWQGSVTSIGFVQDKAAPYAKPGNWNDPDMLVVGQVGWGKLHPSRLTPDEQYSHISLWCLLSAPLLIGCDMTKLDDFTLNLLENDEVLALDQDPLGKQATCALKDGDVRVYLKELEDGGRVIGFFNLGVAPLQKEFGALMQFGIAGKQRVRDLWRQQDVPDVDTVTGTLSVTIPPHGVVLYKFTPIK